MQDNMNGMTQTIARLRRMKGLTQEGLADQLGITFQAVSKWETGASLPDIGLLPMLADIFGVTLDALFGRAAPVTEQPTATPAGSALLPWENDHTLHAAVFMGTQLLEHGREVSSFTFTYEGEALNVDCRCNLRCGDIEGKARAGGNIDCNDVGSAVSAGGNVRCGDIEGFASAGGNMECGDVGGYADAGGYITCGDVSGNVEAEGDLTCKDIEGNVSAGGNIRCGDIGGSVLQCDGNITAGDIGGDARCNGSILMQR